MRFKVQIHKPGDCRTRTGFLWFPRWIGDEIRWLEMATWVETFGPTGTWGTLRWSEDRWARD